MNMFLRDLNNLNDFQARSNYTKAQYSLNEDERKLNGIRTHCRQKFNIFRLKVISILVLAPMLLLFLFAYIGVENSSMYLTLFAWAGLGTIGSIVFNYRYSLTEFRINNASAGEISLDNCLF